MNKPILLLLLFLFASACQLSPWGKDHHGPATEVNDAAGEPLESPLPWAWEGITELRPGDILVRPNLAIAPGSTVVEGGVGFGHAAIVTRGSRHHHPDSLLKQAMLFESHARDVPRYMQLREIPGMANQEDPARHNMSFAPEFEGRRYRLRLDLTPGEIEDVLDYVRAQQGKYSSWMASKPAEGDTVTHWYCSLLVWKAVLDVTGKDLDANGGYYVYPNDLINSPYFDNRQGFKGRSRF